MTGKLERPVMALDYGHVRIGVALSDPTRTLAFARGVVRHSKTAPQRAIQAIAAMVEADDVALIVMGLPRRTDGRASDNEAEVKAFAALLSEATGRDVVFEDERFTTVLALRHLREVGRSAQKMKGQVDAYAAELILQSFLDRRA